MARKHQLGEISAYQRMVSCRHRHIHPSVDLDPRVHGAEYWSEESRENRRLLLATIRNNNRKAAGCFDLAAFYAKCEILEWHCQICGKVLTKDNVTVDHIIPISSSGTNAVENLQPLCGSCNSRKGNRSMERARVLHEIAMIENGNSAIL